MSDYEDDAYADESFEESSPQKQPPLPKGRGASPPESRGSSISERIGHPPAAPNLAQAAAPSSSSSSRKNASGSALAPAAAASSSSVQPTPRDNNLNWLKPTPKTPPREVVSAPSGRNSNTSAKSSPSKSRSPSQQSSRQSSRSSSPASHSRQSSHYSSQFSSPARSPEKQTREKTEQNGVPPLAPSPKSQPPKPTSAPFQSQRPAPAISSDSDSDDRHSDTDVVTSKQTASGSSSRPAAKTAGQKAPANQAVPLLTRVALPTTVQDINLLRLKNAELQRAIDEVRIQLVRLAPRMSVLKVKRRSDEERLKKLQQEATQLAADYQTLSKKCRDANHVKTLEKNIKEREEEIKRLTERNRFLQVEIRQNTKRLRRDENIDDQRKNLLEGLRNERVIAQMNLDRAKKDAESAVKTREALAQRVQELEVKDKLRDMSMDEVKRVIDLKAQIAQRDEAIANLEHRLNVLRRAADSTALSTKPSGLGAAAGVPAPAADQTSLETLREEIAAMKQKLELYSVQRVDEQTVANVKKRQQAPVTQKSPPAGSAASAVAAAKAVAVAGAPLKTEGSAASSSSVAAPGPKPTKKSVGAALVSKPPVEAAWDGDLPAPGTKDDAQTSKSSKRAPAVTAAKAARSTSAERPAAVSHSAAICDAPTTRSESVPPLPPSSYIPNNSASGHYSEDDGFEAPSSLSEVTASTEADRTASSVPAPAPPPQAQDERPPWMVEDEPEAQAPPSVQPNQPSVIVGSAQSETTDHEKPSWLADDSPPRRTDSTKSNGPEHVASTIATSKKATSPPLSHSNSLRATGSNESSQIVPPQAETTAIVASAPAQQAPPTPPTSAPAAKSDEPAWLFDE